MAQYRSLIIVLLISLGIRGVANSQTLYAGLSGGSVNYQGELQAKNFDSRFFHFFGGISGHYEWKRHLAFSAELSTGHLGGRDIDRNRARNLSFDTRIVDFSLFGRINFINNRDIPFIPYIAGGLSIFHVDPYTTDQT